MTPRDRESPGRKLNLIGWRETIGLPDLDIEAMRAKIDTGARTSALHAPDLEVFERDGARWVSFAITKAERRSRIRHEAKIHDERAIKNTSGVPERRIIIRTRLRMGARMWLIEASLADRKEMEFDLILGRTAIRRRGLRVDPGRSFILPLAPPRRRSGKPRGAKTKTNTALTGDAS